MNEQRKLLVLTAVGSDRPGLVSELSKLIHERGANIEDSRMAVLGGEFALVMLISGGSDAMEQIQTASGPVGDRLNLSLFFKETAPAQPKQALLYRLRVTGLDHPGIVQRVSGVLSRFEINVAALDTAVVHAPMTGTPTFVLRADIDIPPSVPVSKAREALLDACVEQNLDCVLEPRL